MSPSRRSSLPKRQRVGAYAVILRGDQILLSRLAPSISPEELWTLPGGGLDHGEDPRVAVLRRPVVLEVGVQPAPPRHARPALR